MSLSDDDKKHMLDEYLRAIDHLQDGNYQKRIWVLAEGPECQDITDFNNDFYDIGNIILERYKDFGITEEQYKLLKRLHDEWEAFNANDEVFEEAECLPENYLKSPEWKHVMIRAKEVLKAFNYERPKKENDEKKD